MQVFTSKIDTWLLLVLLITILVSVGAAFFSIKRGGLKNYFSALAIASIGAVMPLWLLLSTNYTIAGEELMVRSGPFSWSIPIASITSLQDTRNSRSSPALSLDRIRISYGNGQSVMVSPKNKNRFRDAVGH